MNSFYEIKPIRLNNYLLIKFFIPVNCFFSFFCHAQSFYSASKNYPLKIQATPFEGATENGTGNLIGEDSYYSYVLTAGHVVKELNIGDSVTILRTPFGADSPKIYKAELFLKEENATIDIAILRVLHPNDLAQFGGLCLGRDSIDFCGSLDVHLSGFPGGAIYTPDEINQTAVNLNYYNRKQFFRIGSQGIESGHSGSLVTNTNGEVLGMLIKINAVETCAQILKIQTILAFLNEHQVPQTFFHMHPTVRSWYINDIVYINNPETLRHTYNSDYPLLTFQNNGIVTGFINGTYCISNNKITINTTDLVMVESQGQNGDFTSILTPFYRMNDPFTMEFTELGFNFEMGQPGPSVLILRNAEMIVTLLKR